MPEQPISLNTGGLPETVIAAYDAQAVTQLLEALNSPAEHQRALVADVAAKWPRFLDAWVALGQLSQDTVEAYAYFRWATTEALTLCALRDGGVVVTCAGTSRAIMVF